MMHGSDNQYLTEELSAKVNRLKNITLDLEKDVKSQNNYLDSMGFDFSSTSNLLKGGVNRINTMVNSGKGNRKLMFYMILVMVVGFVLLYKILSKWS